MLGGDEHIPLEVRLGGEGGAERAGAVQADADLALEPPIARAEAGVADGGVDLVALEEIYEPLEDGEVAGCIERGLGALLVDVVLAGGADEVQPGELEAVTHLDAVGLAGLGEALGGLEEVVPGPILVVGRAEAGLIEEGLVEHIYGMGLP